MTRALAVLLAASTLALGGSSSRGAPPPAAFATPATVTRNAATAGFPSLAARSPADGSTAARLTGAALLGGGGYRIVQSLTDHVGPRLAGSPSAERAVEWALAQMRAFGLKNVRREPVKVPRWIRGVERVELIAPASVTLHAVALGGSVGTAPGGISAEVLEVGSLDDLKALGPRAQGKLILFNKAMERTPDGKGYGAVVGLRGRGAVEAARLGAAGALIRSVGTGAYRLPHTGATRYDDKVDKIPFAALSAEDADLLHRLIAGGETPRVHLELASQLLGEVDSSNVVGEIPGRDQPAEIVVLGAHLDSWDLGTGAIDDGAGCAIVLEAARLLTALKVQPRRTVRVVLFMNEENGLSGARAYAEAHAAELARHVAAIEADSGAGRPLGFHATSDAAAAWLRPFAQSLAPLHAGGVTTSEMGGADLMPMQGHGVPAIGLAQDMTSYFDWHHTAADTLDKIDPVDLSLDVAAMAVMAQSIADAPDRLPKSPPPPVW